MDFAFGEPLFLFEKVIPIAFQNHLLVPGVVYFELRVRCSCRGIAIHFDGKNYFLISPYTKKITKIEKYKRKNWIKFTYISKCDNDSKIEFTTSSPKTDWIKIWKLQVEIN